MKRFPGLTTAMTAKKINMYDMQDGFPEKNQGEPSFGMPDFV